MEGCRHFPNHFGVTIGFNRLRVTPGHEWRVRIGWGRAWAEFRRDDFRRLEFFLFGAWLAKLFDHLVPLYLFQVSSFEGTQPLENFFWMMSMDSKPTIFLKTARPGLPDAIHAE